MKDSNTYIDLIIAACKKATEYIAELSEEDFRKQSIVQSAVIMQLQVIGEMAKKLDGKIKSEIDVPWNMIVGLRNIIAHDYFMLDLVAVWEIATKNVPEKKNYSLI